MKQTSSVRDRIIAKLTEKFAPEKLDVIDDSARHAGHSGADPRGESHFRILIISEAFTKKPRIERHRMIYLTLEKEITDRIHALEIKAVSPLEIVK